MHRILLRPTILHLTNDKKPWLKGDGAFRFLWKGYQKSSANVVCSEVSEDDNPLSPDKFWAVLDNLNGTAKRRTFCEIAFNLDVREWHIEVLKNAAEIHERNFAFAKANNEKLEQGLEEVTASPKKRKQHLRK